MKTRPKPKKISFIKLTTTTTKTETKTNSKKANKPKKSNTVLNNNLLFINSPKNNFITSTNKYNEKLLTKIKEYSLESQLLNQALQKSSKINKINYIKEIDNEKCNNINDLRFNSLDNNIKNMNIKKIKNRNNNKFNTDRQANPFSNKNMIINTTTNNENKHKHIEYSSKTKSVSKRKGKDIFETNLKLSKQNISKNINVKRNISANKNIRKIGHRKYINRKESKDEFNVINTEENDNLDIHISYNLTAKNSFNFYYPDIQFLSAKNMLEKKWVNKKINYAIKEENEYNILNSERKEKNKNKLEFSFKKCKTNINSKNKNLRPSYKNCFEIKSENINDSKINQNIKRINKKENTLASLHKNRLIFADTNKDALSFCEFQGIHSPDAYSFENGGIHIDKIDEKNKYLIISKNKIVKNKRFNIFKNFDKENSKLIENTKYLNTYKLQKNGGSFYTKRKLYNDKNKKSPTINRIDNQQKLSFLNSPNIKTTFINKKRNECSYDGAFRKDDYFKFYKLRNERGYSASKSHSKSKSKSRSKSQLHKLKETNNHINKLNKIIFSIKTNWGNNLKVGLNNIKLLDKNNKNIPIKNANFDTTKPYQMKYIKGDIKKLTIEYESNYTLKNIIILNGFNDTGIKYLLIENDKGKLLWKGVIPRANLINAKSFHTNVDNTTPNKKRIAPTKATNSNKMENNNNNDINNLKNLNNNTLKNSQINDSSDNLSKNYVLCDRIKIKLLSNYGNKDYIGLSGIQFYDNNDKLINIIQNKKDIKINEAVINLKEKKILYNLFNNKNDVINPKYMFLTTNLNAFINIEFKQNLKLSKIIFYNYNNNIYKDCATKEIFIDFYINNKRQNIMNKSIYLYKPPGEEKIDYGQILSYPFDENSYFNNKINENIFYIKFHNKNHQIIYNEEYQYHCPSFPFGHILKFELFSNYGNKNYIGIENIQIYNEENKEISLFNTVNKNKIKENNNINNAYPKIYLMPEGTLLKSKAKPLILSKLYNFNDVKNNLGENKVYIIFNNFIGISKISIQNYEKYVEIAAKHIKILLDDNIIFEGDLKNIDINNIYFCHKKFFYNKIEKKKMLDKINNLSNEFANKIDEFRKGANNNNKNNLERYVEYEGKNGTKILKLSE